MIGAIGIAISGMTAAAKKVEESAVNIAQGNIPVAGDIINDTVDFSEEAIKLMMAEAEYKANAAVIRTASDMQDDLLDSINKS